MAFKIDRNDLLLAIRELNGLEVVPKLYTKDIENFELLILFLERIESIPEESPQEEALTNSIIKYYNKMARKVEAMDRAAVVAVTENDAEKPKKKPEQVQAVEDFVNKETHIPTKTKMTQITDIMFNCEDDATKDVFGFKLDKKNHQIVKRLVNGKSEGFVIKKEIAADKSEIKAAIDFIVRKHGDNVDIKKSKADDGKIYYKFFAKKGYF